MLTDSVCYAVCCVTAQEKIEPPVYVSDRRLVKAVALMQVRGGVSVCVCFWRGCVGLFG